ncbi:hypothetical protein Taro_043327 [Colocasia esculenta]|uniref:Uncharacterized protein n=1 Tax=Colocasia esculenta TaxID=4460 RepID=A0A843WG48_COLES|nr:hypothetical protein [Colocasia esculenta]
MEGCKGPGRIWMQRRAYLDAAAIAGLRPLRLMHDVAATALGYGIYRAEGHATHVVFVDVGHSDTQVAVVEFEAGQMRYFSALFKEQYNIDVSSNVRASIRLRAACEKLKKVLSANAEAPISFECLMDEKDVKGFIKREDFERQSSDLLERMLVPCKKALADAKLSLDRIQSVELVGSGSRIPAITRMLAGFFKREPRRTLNASECVAMGYALQCAMLSPTFRVRDYERTNFSPSQPEEAFDVGQKHVEAKSVENGKMCYKCIMSCLNILKEIPTLRCYDDFSLQHLELLGDYVLKFAISCNLFPPLRAPLLATCLPGGGSPGNSVFRSLQALHEKHEASTDVGKVLGQCFVIGVPVFSLKFYVVWSLDCAFW